jgi:hypothetical protein
MLTIYDQIRELRAELAATSCARGRAQAEEDLKRLIAEQAKFDRAFDVAEKRRPSLVGRSRLDPSPRRCSPHAPTSPRRHARSRSSSRCTEPLRARKETRTTAPLRPTTDRGSGPITALPTGSGDGRQRGRTRFRNASRDRKRHRRSQLFGASHITRHDAGDGSIPPRDNDERTRQSPLFPVMAKPSDSSPGERPASDRTAAGEQKNDAQTVPPTATQPHVDSVFVPRSVQQSAPKS